MDRILIDSNSVGHAAHQGTILKAGDQQTQAIYGVVKAARALRVRYPDAAIVWLWDGDSWRNKESAVYKANRTDDAKKREARRLYKSQAPFIRRALGHLAQHQLAAANLEADDLAAILTKRFEAKGDHIRLVTGDRDWLQLVSENCTWQDHRDEAKRVNIQSLPHVTGYATVDQFVQSKALEGDVSDNLPGVGGIGEVKAKLLLSVWGRVEAFLADPQPQSTWELKTPQKENSKGIMTSPSLPKVFADFHANKDGRHEKFFTNMHLMNLRGNLPAPERLALNKGSFDPEAFKALCHELGFASIYRPEAFDTFVEPFKTRIN
jgi:5'-3' exonuclease